MKKGFDIHHNKKDKETAIRKLKNNPQISDRNKELILKYVDHCELKPLSIGRILRYLSVLASMAVILKVDFDKATKEDIMRLIRIYQTRDYTPWTLATNKMMIKTFYKWIKNTEDYFPEEVRWIKANIKRSERKQISHSELITEKDIQKLIRVAHHPREKAFVAVLYESGARIGEIATLQLKNVKFDKHGAMLDVTGKTGPRSIRVISSTPYLSTWMESHPLKDNPDAPLWVNYSHGHPLLAMSYDGLRFSLVRLFKAAGIKKRCNPHLFRHSRATFLADHLTEFQMNSYFGWIQGSNMPATYIHMSGSNLDSAMLELNGVSKQAKAKETSLKPKICPRCDTINPHDAKFCKKCAGAMDIHTALELEDKMKKEKTMRNKYDGMLNSFMEDPEFLQMFKRKMDELNSTKN